MSNAPKKLLLVNHCSPGDVLMLAAAVRDLHPAAPGRYLTAVDTLCPALWENNPYVVPPGDGAGFRRIDCHHPPLLDRCNGQPRHYVESVHHLLSRVLGIHIPLTRFASDLHLTTEEKANPPCDARRPYWLLVGGGKRDVTIKWWPRRYYQAVVDHFRGELQFVQAGAREDHHPELDDVLSLVGRTGLREFVRLIYHADGVVCPTTFAMHAAAAFDKPCVVIGGGREPPHWEMYPRHQYLHTVGQLPCCAGGGCWRARVVPLRDGDGGRDNNLCVRPLELEGEPVAACMKMIEPPDVIRAVRRYLDGWSGK